MARSGSTTTRCRRSPRLRERGVRTALVSNCSNATRPIVEQLGLPALFDAVILSFEVGVRKPEPGIYQAALRRSDAEPPDAVFVDDQTSYCDGARALGIDTRLIVRDGAQPAEGFAPSTNGHPVITDLTSLAVTQWQLPVPSSTKFSWPSAGMNFQS